MKFYFHVEIIKGLWLQLWAFQGMIVNVLKESQRRRYICYCTDISYLCNILLATDGIEFPILLLKCFTMILWWYSPLCWVLFFPISRLLQAHLKLFLLILPWICWKFLELKHTHQKQLLYRGLKQIFLYSKVVWGHCFS